MLTDSEERHVAGTSHAVRPKLLSFDVFGTLMDTPPGHYLAKRTILDDLGGREIESKKFWDYWQTRNVSRYKSPYISYKENSKISLGEAVEHFKLPGGNLNVIERYFDSYRRLQPYPDVERALDLLARNYSLAVVSNIDDDLLAVTQIGRQFDLVCTAQRAGGYKPDGTLFKYLIENAGVPVSEIFHSGQSQHTDMVGGKPLGLTIAWINRNKLELHPTVPRPDFVLPDVQSLVPLLRDYP
jgi:2-haloacid dehalogenase